MIHKDFNCEIYFIRHGQSESNATPGIAAGVNFDGPLTKLGHHQAQLLGERFKNDEINFDKIYKNTKFLVSYIKVKYKNQILK